MKVKENTKSGAIRQEIEAKYAKAVKRCIDCEFGLPGSDMLADEPPEEFYGNTIRKQGEPSGG